MQIIKQWIYIAKAIWSARKVQDFLWGKVDGEWGVEEWLKMFRKRVVKLEEIDIKHPHATIEMKKRLLQTAALSIAMLANIEKILESTTMIGHHLPKFSEKLTEEKNGRNHENQKSS